MKIEKTGTTSPARRIGIAAYAKRAEAVAEVATTAQVTALASVMGIPEAEFTPKVREAVMSLMSEVDSLRRELSEIRRRLEDAEKTADQDQLLPLLNRRAFVRELMRTISMAGRYGVPSTLIYFDLDDFKRVNDTHGHAAGDAVLAHFAQTLLANVRDSDTVGRLGGDEFGILLSHANLAQGKRKADHLAAVLESSPAVWSGKSIPVRFSCGAFELKGGDTADLAIARADAEMYAHKRRQANGR
jgi:diguanylate cyclase (GGDEF)-like protein